MLASFFTRILWCAGTASILILAVLLCRFLLKKGPKWVACLLWLPVGIRLLCPITISSPIGFLYSYESFESWTQQINASKDTDFAETNSEKIQNMDSETNVNRSPATNRNNDSETDLSDVTKPVTTGKESESETTQPETEPEGNPNKNQETAKNINSEPDLSEIRKPVTLDTEPETQLAEPDDEIKTEELSSAINPEVKKTSHLKELWLAIRQPAKVVYYCGVFLFLSYFVLSSFMLKRKLRYAEREDGNLNIYRTDAFSEPFLFGFPRPRIYLPYTMTEEQKHYVFAHEQAHIRRGDYFLKPISFLALSLYWFCPFVWLSYLMFCKDIELACDERVLKTLSQKERKEYSSVLLSLSQKEKQWNRLPLAFGEISVKERIKKALHYRKPAVYLTAAGLLLCAVLFLCLGTEPQKTPKESGLMVTDVPKQGDDQTQDSKEKDTAVWKEGAEEQLLAQREAILKSFQLHTKKTDPVLVDEEGRTGYYLYFTSTILSQNAYQFCYKDADTDERYPNAVIFFSDGELKESDLTVFYDKAPEITISPISEKEGIKGTVSIQLKIKGTAGKIVDLPYCITVDGGFSFSKDATRPVLTEVDIEEKMIGFFREDDQPETEEKRLDSVNSENPLLTEYFIDHFDQNHNGFLSREERLAVTELDLSKEQFLFLPVKGLEIFENLKALTLPECGTVELKGLSNLELLSITDHGDTGSAQIDSIWISDCDSLKTIHYGCSDFPKLTVENCKSLQTIDKKGYRWGEYGSVWSFFDVPALKLPKETEFYYPDTVRKDGIDITESLLLKNEDKAPEETAETVSQLVFPGESVSGSITGESFSVIPFSQFSQDGQSTFFPVPDACQDFDGDGKKDRMYQRSIQTNTTDEKRSFSGMEIGILFADGTILPMIKNLENEYTSLKIQLIELTGDQSPEIFLQERGLGADSEYSIQYFFTKTASGFQRLPDPLSLFLSIRKVNQTNVLLRNGALGDLGIIRTDRETQSTIENEMNLFLDLARYGAFVTVSSCEKNPISGQSRDAVYCRGTLGTRMNPLREFEWIQVYEEGKWRMQKASVRDE